MTELTKEIDARMADGSLPEVTYRTTIRDGIPADEDVYKRQHYYPPVLAVADEKQHYTYQALHTQAKTWAGVLYEQGWRRGMR